MADLTLLNLAAIAALVAAAGGIILAIRLWRGDPDVTLAVTIVVVGLVATIGLALLGGWHPV